MGILSKIDQIGAKFVSSDVLRKLMSLYPAKQGDRPPWTPLKKPLSECKVALITSAGIHLPEDKPFDMESRNGDPSYRVVPNDLRSRGWQVSHSHYRREGVEADFNIVLPIEYCEQLVDKKVIGSLAEKHYSFMGYIPKTALLLETYAPEVAGALVKDGVDVAILTPT